MAKENQPYFKFVKSEASNEATIYIYGVIGGFDYETYELINTADKFVKEFNALGEEVKTVHVRINSPGGYIFEGQAIYNTLVGSDKKIITYNDGLCASMAAIILLAGEEIHAFSNSLLMIHNSSGGAYGNKKEIEAQLEAYDKFDEALGTAIEELLDLTTEEVAEKYLNYQDNWFTAKEADAEGFYTSVISKKKGKVSNKVKNMNPQQLFQYAAVAIKFPEEKSQITNPNNMSKPNSYPNLEAALGAPLATTDKGSYLNEDQKAAIDNKIAADATALQAANSAKESAETALQAEKDSRQAAIDAEKGNTTAAVAALRAAATEAGVENLADDADMATINAALTAQIQVLNKKPGATHTAKGAEEKPDAGKYADLVDRNNSIYSQLNK